MVPQHPTQRPTGLALLESASAARIAVVGVGVGGTLTLSRLAERADQSWRGTVLDVVDHPDSLGRGRAFGADIGAAAVNTSAHRLEALSPSFHSFDAWLSSTGVGHSDLDDAPMPRPVYGDYLAATLAQAIGRLRDCGVRVRLHPMHASAIRSLGGGIVVRGDADDLPPADIAVLAPGVWSPPAPAISRQTVAPYPLSGLRARVGGRRSVAVLGSGLTAVDVACALDDGDTAVHMLSRSGSLPRIQVQAARSADAPVFLTETAIRSSAHDLTLAAVLALLDRELARFGRSRSDIVSDAAHSAHWADPLADPADLACYHVLSATNGALNAAFALLPRGERDVLRESLDSRWFRYRVRVPISRWRQLRSMLADGRLVVHGGVDAATTDLDQVMSDLGVEHLVPALGQSTTLTEGPELVAGLSRVIACDDAGQGLVDPATCRALTPEGSPRDDLLLVGQVSAGSYFTVSALDVLAGQADRAAATIAGLITTRTSLRTPAAEKAA